MTGNPGIIRGPNSIDGQTMVCSKVVTAGSATPAEEGGRLTHAATGMAHTQARTNQRKPGITHLNHTALIASKGCQGTLHTVSSDPLL